MSDETWIDSFHLWSHGFELVSRKRTQSQAILLFWMGKWVKETPPVFRCKGVLGTRWNGRWKRAEPTTLDFLNFDTPKIVADCAWWNWFHKGEFRSGVGFSWKRGEGNKVNLRKLASNYLLTTVPRICLDWLSEKRNSKLHNVKSWSLIESFWEGNKKELEWERNVKLFYICWSKKRKDEQIVLKCRSSHCCKTKSMRLVSVGALPFAA